MNYILLGGVQSVLPILRSLSKEGLQVQVICEKNDIASKSKYGGKYFITPDLSVVDIVKNIVSVFGESVCILGSEAYVKYSSELFNIDKLSLFAMSTEDLHCFSNKVKAYEFAKTKDVDILDFSPLNSDYCYELQFPAIVKWAVHGASNDIPKTKIVKDINELRLYKEKIHPEYQSKLIVQSLLSDYKSYSFGSIWKRGKLIDFTVVNQLRQFPLGITSSVSLAEDKIQEKIKNIIHKLFSDTDVHGFLEVEFIVSESRFYMIDINPRVWGWSSALFYKHNLMWDKILSDKHETNILPVDDGYSSWVNVLRDVPAIIRSNLTLKEKFIIYKSYFDKNTNLQFIDFRDPIPEMFGIIK